MNLDKSRLLVLKDIWLVYFDPCFYMEKQTIVVMFVHIIQEKKIFSQMYGFHRLCWKCICVLVFRQNTKVIFEIGQQIQESVQTILRLRLTIMPVTVQQTVLSKMDPIERMLKTLLLFQYQWLVCMIKFKQVK